MKPDKIPPSANSPSSSDTSTQEPTGHHQGHQVKRSLGQKFTRWMSSLKMNFKAGMALLHRSIRQIPAITPPLMSGLYWEQVPLPNNPEQLRELAIDSAVAQIPYKLNHDPVRCWEIVREAENILMDSSDTDRSEALHHKIEPRFFEEILSCAKEDHCPEQKTSSLTPEQQDMATSECFRNITLLPSGMIIDHTTGLIAVMAINQVTHKITLVFGGTNSANGASKLLDENGQETGTKSGRLRAQLKADWQNLLGYKIPDCYRQASRLVELIKSMTHSKATLKAMGLDNSLGMLFLVGHSLGGGLVQYSAAKNRVPGRTFNPVALGRKAIKNLTIDDKELAKNGLIDNYLIHHDLINTPFGYKRWHKRLAPTILGRRTIIHAHKATGKNTLYGRHSRSHVHYMAELRRKINASK
ncbi:hypothetical protein J7438_00875 [Thalassotalea sp. G20_0]|uniref:hypothetical protein n=1 Tax=Thalassotalea sp. G20_0 TaxID=2821093 RepID=UPI001ADBBEEF|nr:hypothetical protein [Thalassotalea sp. G20_0]MBO9492650.1 hypothetical protein [Thalassotalea sp. G20_0]